MKNKLFFITLIALAIACKKNIITDKIVTNTTNPTTNGSNDVIAPSNFQWQFLQDYLISLTTDTRVDNVSFTLIDQYGSLVYEGVFNYGYSNFSLRIPRDLKILKIVSNSPKILAGQTIDLTASNRVYVNNIVIKNSIQADKLWVKKTNEGILENKGKQLFKGNDIISLWEKYEYVYTRTLFEDMWPSRADFDFNDMVVDNYNSVVFKSPTNQPTGVGMPAGLGNKVISQINGTYIIQANGAGFNNGLAVELFGEFHNADGSITAMPNLANYITNCSFTNSSGRTNSTANLETLPNGQVVIVLFKRINDVRNSIYQNTEADAPFSLGDTVTFTINLNTKIDDEFWKGRYCNFSYSNLFLLQNSDRSVEIHIPGEKPTMLANTALFGTSEDNTNLASGKTYVSKKYNFPWVLAVPSNFIWSTEKVDLIKAYPNFNNWVKNNGIYLNDWRFNKVDSLLKNIY